MRYRGCAGLQMTSFGRAVEGHQVVEGPGPSGERTVGGRRRAAEAAEDSTGRGCRGERALLGVAHASRVGYHGAVSRKTLQNGDVLEAGKLPWAARPELLGGLRGRVSRHSGKLGRSDNAVCTARTRAETEDASAASYVAWLQVETVPGPGQCTAQRQEVTNGRRRSLCLLGVSGYVIRENAIRENDIREYVIRENNAS